MLDQNPFGNFNAEAMGRKASFLQNGLEFFDQGLLKKLFAGHVDAQPQALGLGEGFSPHLHLVTGCPQHPPPQGDDQPRFLGDGDEGIGGQQPLAGMLPPHQGFKPNHLTGLHIHNGLILQSQFVAHNGLAQIDLKL